MSACITEEEFDIDKPKYDLETYSGRAMYYFQTTNPLNLFAGERELERARCIVKKVRCKERLPESLTREELWRAKILYDSAFHPDTGDKMNLIGRMSAQVPCNMLITGGMMTFYKTVPAVVFWQWINQSFNALVNYTNRGGGSQQSEKQLVTTYLIATTGAVATALGLNSLVKTAPPVIGRFVPFAAVAAANCINIPMMRSQEIKYGTPIFDADKKKLGVSKEAAKSGIAQVTFSRIAMAAPGMVLVPFVMNHLERRGTLCRYPWLQLPLQVGLVGLCLTFATPLACAFFKQQAQFSFSKLEPDVQESIKKRCKGHPPKYVYYNKGL